MNAHQRATVARLVARLENTATTQGCYPVRSTTESRGICGDRTDQGHNPACLVFRAELAAGRALLAAEHVEEPVQGRLLGGGWRRCVSGRE